ncbi:hypothetical protein ACSL103130_07430 [Actinomyces slackii]|uniref:Uncharacterized protein n=2 Tax=Actinomyces slackii TaxID=52774 RepID=A0A3S4UPK7_9ACTO|nr:Uncharacterised protein [Actinomyces slackii]
MTLGLLLAASTGLGPVAVADETGQQKADAAASSPATPSDADEPTAAAEDAKDPEDSGDSEDSGDAAPDARAGQRDAACAPQATVTHPEGQNAQTPVYVVGQPVGMTVSGWCSTPGTALPHPGITVNVHHGDAVSSYETEYVLVVNRSGPDAGSAQGQIDMDALLEDVADIHGIVVGRTGTFSITLSSQGSTVTTGTFIVTDPAPEEPKEPTPSPTASPSSEPTAEPTESPRPDPTPSASAEPSTSPAPSASPSAGPSAEPSTTPSAQPSASAEPDPICDPAKARSQVVVPDSGAYTAGQAIVLRVSNWCDSQGRLATGEATVTVNLSTPGGYAGNPVTIRVLFTQGGFEAAVPAAVYNGVPIESGQSYYLQISAHGAIRGSSSFTIIQPQTPAEPSPAPEPQATAAPAEPERPVEPPAAPASAEEDDSAAATEPNSPALTEAPADEDPASSAAESVVERPESSQDADSPQQEASQDQRSEDRTARPDRAPVAPVSDASELSADNAGSLSGSRQGNLVTLILPSWAVAEGDWVSVFVFPGGKTAGWVQVGADNSVTIDISSLGSGSYELAVASRDNALLGWARLEIAEASYAPGDIREARVVTGGELAAGPGLIGPDDWLLISAGGLLVLGAASFLVAARSGLAAIKR